jgi:hypothetical protein
MVVEQVTGRSTPIDRRAFVSAAVAFLSDREPLAVMGARAARHVGEHLTFHRQLHDTLALYRSLVPAGN